MPRSISILHYYTMQPSYAIYVFVYQQYKCQKSTAKSNQKYIKSAYPINRYAQLRSTA